jgi:hypothetical protein
VKDHLQFGAQSNWSTWHQTKARDFVLSPSPPSDVASSPSLVHPSLVPPTRQVSFGDETLDDP